MTYKTSTDSSDASIRLGERVGRLLKPGDVVELSSDLGGGKTTFIKGLARGLGYTGEVTSPTFTISRVYQLPGGVELHHFDFYRLDSTDIVNRELAEIVGQPDTITVIEWAQNAANVLPPERLRIVIDRQSDTSRDIAIQATDQRYQRVIEGLRV